MKRYPTEYRTIEILINLKRFQKSLSEKFKFSTERSDIQFFGLCERCKDLMKKKD
ncbi:MAG: hypothetical protein RMI30_00650 [Thermodesulfovibrio sp.]|nr:hypothetical protein [Thermodesulfovibrio sp.]